MLFPCRLPARAAVGKRLMPDLQKIYAARFEQTGLEKRRRVWRVLCQNFFNDLVGPNETVLDLACGYGEFINSVRAGKKIAVDLNPDAKNFLAPDVTHYLSAATDLSAVPAGTVDVVFTSNFLEHLKDKAECDKVFAEVKKVLRPGGRFIVLGPNIHYAFKEYWDYYDHYLPLSHLSLAEGLGQAGFQGHDQHPALSPLHHEFVDTDGGLAGPCLSRLSPVVAHLRQAVSRRGAEAAEVSNFVSRMTQFVLFALVGGIAALVNILARLGFSLVTPFEVAIVLAFPVALTVAFLLNRYFVFSATDGHAPSQYARFLLVNLVALVQVFVVSVLLARVIFPWAQFTWNAETVAHVIGVLSPIVTSYALHKSFTFGNSAELDRA